MSPGSLTHLSDGPVRVVVSGELDIETVPLLREALDAAEYADGRGVILDLAAVSFIDSTGLQLLLSRKIAATADAPQLRIVASDVVRRLVDLAGVQHVIDLEASGG